MKLVDFGRWTTAKTALALAGALAIAGAIGTAVAMSPIVQPPIKWQGGVEFGRASIAGGAPAYQVPSGRNFLLTDLVVGNLNDAVATLDVYSATALIPMLGLCPGGSPQRLYSLVIPPRSTTALSLQTGMGFASGQYICLTSSANVSYNARGFLFTAAPAS